MSKNRKTPLLKQLRICLAASVFAAFVLLFLNPGKVFDEWLGWLPKLEFWPAVLAMDAALCVLLLILTAVFGRAYCSVLCPLGVMQDGIYRLGSLGKKTRRFRMKWTRPMNVLRYGVMTAFIVCSVAGLEAFAYVLEPYSLFGRMVTSLAGKSLTVALVTLALFVIIAVMAFRSGRTWCNTVCPVGALLSVVSRKSLFRPVIDEDKCVNCGLCGKGCRSGCIDTASHTVDMSRCTLCFDCLDNCNTGAISFKAAPVMRERKGGDNQPGGMSRRAFLSVGALAVGSAAAKAQEEVAHGGMAVLLDKKVPERSTPVVPPGALSLARYDKHCVGCQLCVSACPNHVLRPSTKLDSMFMQPVMGFEKGFCRPECTACSDVCPAGAIQSVTKEEKSSISIGHAVFIPENCVVVTDAVKCGNCARHCPAGAISMVKQDPDSAFGFDSSNPIPSVNPERCIGCGRCEYVCPSRPLSAIYVEGNEVHRKL